MPFEALLQRCHLQSPRCSVTVFLLVLVLCDGTSNFGTWFIDYDMIVVLGQARLEGVMCHRSPSKTHVSCLLAGAEMRQPLGQGQYCVKVSVIVYKSIIHLS